MSDLYAWNLEHSYKLKLKVLNLAKFGQSFWKGQDKFCIYHVCKLYNSVFIMSVNYKIKDGNVALLPKAKVENCHRKKQLETGKETRIY